TAVALGAGQRIRTRERVRVLDARPRVVLLQRAVVAQHAGGREVLREAAGLAAAGREQSSGERKGDDASLLAEFHVAPPPSPSRDESSERHETGLERGGRSRALFRSILSRPTAEARRARSIAESAKRKR